MPDMLHIHHYTGRVLRAGVLFWLSFLIAHSTVAQTSLSGLPFVRNFHTIQYQAGIQNWQITQDRRGLVYIANNFGLLEYDGNTWQVYRVKTGTKVRSAAVDKSGRIYVGSQGEFGYFAPNPQGKLAYTSLADSLPPQYRDFDEAWSVYIDDSKVYFCTFSRLYIYEAGRFEVVEPGAAIDLSFLVNRRLYVNVWGKGLHVLEGKTIRPLKGGDYFNHRGISTVLALQDDHLLISTFQHGIFQLQDGVVTPWNEALQQTFREANVNCVLRLRNGNFAIGTQNNGLMVLNQSGQLHMQLTRGRGLENRTVLSLYEDDLNNLWVGQNNGISYVELGSPFSFINEQSGLPGTGYAAYLDGKRFYLGTNTGLYIQDEVDKHFRLVPNTRGQVYHIGRYFNDLLVGHHHGAMLAGEDAKSISGEPGSWIFIRLKDHPDKLVEGTYSGLQLYTLDNGHWRFVRKLKGFGESSRVMEEDASGYIWVTHGYRGAYRIRLSPALDSVQEVKFYGADKGFPSNLLINVFKVRNELFFTGEQGIFQYDAKQDRFVPDRLFTPVLGQEQVWFMREDALGNIYFVGDQHIGVFHKNAFGEYTLESSTFNKIRKYLNDDLLSITTLRNNEVLFGAKDGFIHYDPTKAVSKVSFNTLIRKVSLTGQGDSVVFFGSHPAADTTGQQRGDDLRFANQHNSVNFTFSATAYEGNADITYQYYLENYEKAWSEWTSRTEKEYTNLKEGKYIFHVRARNSNGDISDEARYTFSIAPPWYRSIWAYALYAAAVVALLFTAFNLLDRKYQREQRQRELEQQEVLNQKEDELEKLSQQSQEEINRLQSDKLESELRHANNELATATMHLLNKNEFIAGIKTSLGHVLKRNMHDEARRELQQITRDIENNISADSDWEHFQFHFDRVHGDFTGRFRAAFPGLSPQEIKLSAYLRMNLSTKEIAQLLNISVRGVEISRYRLRKKLQLDRTQNLQDFILNF